MLSPRTAVIVVFALNGAALGSWAPRVPALAAQMHTEPGPLGLALLGSSVGMLLAAVVSGRLVERTGPRLMIAVSVVVAGLLLPAIGATTSVPLFGVELLALGAAVGVLDVAMNIAAVQVERDEGKPIMPLFHAGFSVGALIGSAAAGLAASHDWSPERHLAVAGAFAIVVLLAVLRDVPGTRPPRHEKATAPRVAPARRPVLWLLAAIALASAIAEGASSDWSAMLMVNVHGVGQGAGALAFSAFSLAMACARVGGSWLQRKLGPTRTLAFGALLAGAGLVSAALIPLPAVGFAGFVLAGAGLAASFPVALGLAGEAGKRADGSGGEREIAFVTAIAYTGFLAGPPMIGGIAQVTSYAGSFVVVAVIALLIAPAAIGAVRARAAEGERAESALPGAVR
ncbi:MFS transporter [Amycolatopsis sp. CA-230715]|uniref:MFS transporter n=1 Tax=Amycolatopsis sp. CA-230715 TaxID=2745196 RepID=UPI001C01F9C5|nr:MFS transporter [Amycolatopsis sp. CA-230715]QWF83450.1 Inner membrane protein YbjJ [Amycolatopsis sp. CA-230715]